uniref:Uncharacterized protein n=1 Tax=Siphoviridae sp. ctnNB1 TaxID=2825660 RepID=A0A8S5UV68_9CAUD|nr:MAG TPA: hypothetical protein [Siphoviridae sp. ctnNB1]
MKVYELMNALSKANAGADVKISFSMTESEYVKGDAADVDLRVFRKEIEDVEFDGDWKISIYA